MATADAGAHLVTSNDSSIPLLQQLQFLFRYVGLQRRVTFTPAYYPIQKDHWKRQAFPSRKRRRCFRKCQKFDERDNEGPNTNCDHFHTTDFCCRCLWYEL